MMFSQIYYLLTLSKPTGERGKIIIFQRNLNFETHWSAISGDTEETIIQDRKSVV